MSDERNPDPGDDELLLDEPETDVEEFDGEIEDLEDDPDEDDGDDADEPVAEEPRPRRRADVAAELEQTRANNRQIVANQIISRIPQRAAQLKEQFEKVIYAPIEQQDAHWQQQAENEARLELFKIHDAADQEAFRKYRASKGLSKLHGNQVEQFLAQARQQGYWNLKRADASIYLRGLAADGGGRTATASQPAGRRSNGRGKLTASDMALLRRMRVKDLG